jgi:O-antigen/teichoic acid export membrane protein
MGTDYYPRLASVAHSNALSKRTINQQAEISVLLISPILIAFIVFINWIIILLYSRQFVPINDMIYWAALGMLFKAASWAISFLFLVKGGSLFFYNELSANIYILGLNIAGYFFFGLAGLGISFLIGYLIYLVQVFLISKARFEFLFNSDFIKIFGIQLLLLIVSFIAVKSTNNPYSYIFGITLILISTWFSYKELDKRIDIKQIIVSFREKFNI